MDMEEIFHTHNLSNVGPLSVKPWRERLDPEGTRKVTILEYFWTRPFSCFLCDGEAGP